MIIALDVGHMGKRSSPKDRGAVNGIYREANFALQYSVTAWKILENFGHTTFLLCYNNYSNRLEFCDLVKADIHVHCHINSAENKNADYGLVKYREDGNADNARICHAVSRHLQEQLGPVISKVDVKTLSKEERGFDCLKSNIPSILYEPLFIQNDDHLNFLLSEDGLVKIGTALANAINEWGKQRGKV